MRIISESGVEYDRKKDDLMNGIKIVSINCNKSLAKNVDKISKMTYCLKPDLYLFQEPTRKSDEEIKIAGYNYLGGNEYLAAYSSLPANIERFDERWCCVLLECKECKFKIHNVYLSPYNSNSRKTLIKKIQKDFSKKDREDQTDKKIYHLFFGDFNLAPERKDGQKCKDGHCVDSNFNKEYERKAFREFHDIGYCDVFRYFYPYNDEFTIEKVMSGVKTKFRCDLAIAPEELLELSDGHVEIFHLHGTRKGEHRFTDHSGMFLSINKYKPIQNDLKGPSPTVKNFLEYNEQEKGFILDYGCGKEGRDVNHLKGKRYKIVGYDPYLEHLKQPSSHSCTYNNLHKLFKDDEELQKELKKETPQKFKHIFMTYVVNTIPQKEECISAILNAMKYLDRDGQLWITIGYTPRNQKFKKPLAPEDISEHIHDCNIISGLKFEKIFEKIRSDAQTVVYKDKLDSSNHLS